MDWIGAYADVQAVPAALAGRWWALAAVACLTLAFGRAYCRFVCPLGILQSLARLFRGPRRVCTRLRTGYGGRSRVAVNAVALCLFLALGLLGLGWQWLDPYALASRAVYWFASPELDDLAVAAFALAPFLLILALAAAAGGRIWCNWACPLGVVFTVATRLSWRKDKVSKGAGCAKCGKCFARASAADGPGREASK